MREYLANDVISWTYVNLLSGELTEQRQTGEKKMKTQAVLGNEITWFLLSPMVSPLPRLLLAGFSLGWFQNDMFLLRLTYMEGD